MKMVVLMNNLCFLCVFQLEVLQESKMMIPDCHRRLTIAHADLSQILVRTAPFFLPGGGLKIIKSHGSNPRATVTKMDSVRKEEMLRGTRLWRWSQSSFVLVAAGLSRCLVFWTSMCVWFSVTLSSCRCVWLSVVSSILTDLRSQREEHTPFFHTHMHVSGSSQLAESRSQAAVASVRHTCRKRRKGEEITDDSSEGGWGDVTATCPSPPHTKIPSHQPQPLPARTHTHSLQFISSSVTAVVTIGTQQHSISTDVTHTSTHTHSSALTRNVTLWNQRMQIVNVHFI